MAVDQSPERLVSVGDENDDVSLLVIDGNDDDESARDGDQDERRIRLRTTEIISMINLLAHNYFQLFPQTTQKAQQNGFGFLDFLGFKTCVELMALGKRFGKTTTLY